MNKILVFLLFAIPTILNAQQTEQPKVEFTFRTENTVLLLDFQSNSKAHSKIEQWTVKNYKPSTTKTHFSITAFYDKNDPISINRAAIQASTVASQLRKISNDKNLRYIFFLNLSTIADRVDVAVSDDGNFEGDNNENLLHPQ